jgi:Ca2+/Na+ antiporter
MVCPTCLFLPLALTSAVGTVSTKNLVFFQISLFITLLFLVLYIYKKYYSDCQSCKPKKDIISYIQYLKEKYFNFF